MEFPAPPKVHVIHVRGVDPDRDAIVDKLDAEADLCVHLDNQRLYGCAGNWLRALTCAAGNDAELPWSIIVSDDAMPLRGWQQHLERACRYSPEPFLGLTHFGGYGEKAIDRRVPYGVGKYLLWGGAIGYHSSQVRGLAEWATRVYSDTGYPHDDCLVAGYAMKVGVRTALAARAIFGQPIKASLLGHNTPIRSPKTTILDPGPDWSSKPVSIPVSRGISPSDELQRLAAL